MDKIFKGVKITEINGQLYCEFEDYKQARIKQGIRWSEKSFCDWCDKYNIEAVG